MTSHHRIQARNAGLDKVRRVTTRVASGGLVLSGAIAALASATYGGSTNHRAQVAPLTDPTLPPTTLATPSTGSTSQRTTPTTSAPTTVAPLQAPQSTPQTQPYTPPVVVSGGS